MVRRASSAVSFAGTTFVAVQHLLGTTATLLRALIDLGAEPGRIFVLGKPYSSHAGTVRTLREIGIRVQQPTPVKPGRFAEIFERDLRKMWRIVLADAANGRRIVVLDDGGHCLATIPSRLQENAVGIEQTTSGIQRQNALGRFPIIQVASSAAKTFLEPPMISAAVLTKTRKIVDLHGAKVYGVVGLGHIGRAVARQLSREGTTVVVFDRDRSKMNALPETSHAHTLDDVFLRAAVIFGCTGTDLAREGDWIRRMSGKKVLVSCSSEDIEFQSLVRLVAGRYRRRSSPPYQRPLIFHDEERDLCIQIVRSGFPVNFDGSEESVPAAHIQMTRALLLLALIQAQMCERTARSQRGGEMLNAAGQEWIIRTWCALQPQAASAFGFELDVDRGWVIAHSQGEELFCTKVDQLFASERRSTGPC
jgi:S-adenosylhomocysteine hydrolase